MHREKKYSHYVFFSIEKNMITLKEREKPRKLTNTWNFLTNKQTNKEVCISDNLLHLCVFNLGTFLE